LRYQPWSWTVSYFNASVSGAAETQSSAGMRLNRGGQGARAIPRRYRSRTQAPTIPR
jgi:hypothetical protein